MWAFKPKLRSGLLVTALLLLLAGWGWQRGPSSTEAPSGNAISTTDVETSKVASPTRGDAFPRAHATITALKSTRPSHPAAVAADVEAPSAECRALRAEKAGVDAALAALDPTTIDALVEGEAQALAGADGRLQDAVSHCQGEPESTHEACIQREAGEQIADDPQHLADAATIAQALRSAAEQLAQRADARSLVAAATLLPPDEPVPAAAGSAAAQRSPHVVAPSALAARATVWLVRAQRLAPDDAAVQWAVAMRRGGTGDESPELATAVQRALARLRQLEPDNAAVAIQSLFAERGRGWQPDAVELSALAVLPEFEGPAARLMNLVDEASTHLAFSPASIAAMRRLGRDDLADRTELACAREREVVEQTILIASVSRAGLAAADLPIWQACSRRRVDEEERRRAPCLAIASRIAEQDMSISRTIAGTIARSIAREGPERDRWIARHRRQSWQQERFNAVLLNRSSLAQARMFLAAWRAGGEHHAIEAALRESGIALDPPEEWEPGP